MLTAGIVKQIRGFYLTKPSLGERRQIELAAADEIETQAKEIASLRASHAELLGVLKQISDACTLPSDYFQQATLKVVDEAIANAEKVT